jgi:uncharacterized damage-inducible protein DinB
MKSLRLLVLGVLLPGTVAAQAVATLKEVWMGPIGNVTQAAQDVPDSLYSFRPVPTVRTLGQLFGHVAGAQNYICSLILGDPERPEDGIEKSVTTKAGLVAALKASTEYCTRAYAISDAAAQKHATFHKRDLSKLFLLALNAAHDNEHYGNIVTYMRMNGMVPPSSRGQ